MADTAVAITAGSGTNIDTRTEATNGNHRQVVVLGDPSTNAGVAPVDATNGLSVSVTNASLTVASHAVTNAGTFAVQESGSALTALQLIDNIVLLEDAAHSTGDPGVMSLAVRKATTPTDRSAAATDGDYEPLQVDGNGRLYANSAIYTPNGDSAMDDTNDCVKVSIVADSVGSTVDTEDGTVATGQSSVALTIAQVYEYDGTNWTRPRGEHTVAHDAADAGNPAKLGAKAKSALNGITLVASDDRTDLYADLDGVLITRNASLGDVVQERATNTDGASTAFASGLAAPGAGIRLWITNVDICNSSASFCTVDLRDGSAGSVLWTLPVPATGGVVKTFDPPLKLSANTALAYDASAATTTLTVSANGFKSKL